MIVRACRLLQEFKYRITGVAVLDIVEGALDTLSYVSRDALTSRKMCLRALIQSAMLRRPSLTVPILS